MFYICLSKSLCQLDTKYHTHTLMVHLLYRINKPMLTCALFFCLPSLYYHCLPYFFSCQHHASCVWQQRMWSFTYILSMLSPPSSGSPLWIFFLIIHMINQWKTFRKKQNNHPHLWQSWLVCHPGTWQSSCCPLCPTLNTTVVTQCHHNYFWIAQSNHIKTSFNSLGQSLRDQMLSMMPPVSRQRCTEAPNCAVATASFAAIATPVVLSPLLAIERSAMSLLMESRSGSYDPSPQLCNCSTHYVKSSEKSSLRFQSYIHLSGSPTEISETYVWVDVHRIVL